MKCYEVHKRFGKSCNKLDCRYWIESEENNNCTIIGAESGPMTLQEIGDIFGITRMRVCQIEKKIMNKLKLHLL